MSAVILTDTSPAAASLGDSASRSADDAGSRFGALLTQAADDFAPLAPLSVDATVPGFDAVDDVESLALMPMASSSSLAARTALAPVEQAHRATPEGEGEGEAADAGDIGRANGVTAEAPPAPGSGAPATVEIPAAAPARTAFTAPGPVVVPDDAGAEAPPIEEAEDAASPASSSQPVESSASPSAAVRDRRDDASNDAMSRTAAGAGQVRSDPVLTAGAATIERSPVDGVRAPVEVATPAGSALSPEPSAIGRRPVLGDQSASAAAPMPIAPVSALALQVPTATVVQAATPAAVVPPPVLAQVSPVVIGIAQRPAGAHQLTMTVNPDSFGPVTVRAHIGAGGDVRVELIGATDAGRDALRAVIVDLRRDLAAAMPHASLSVANGASADAESGAQSFAGGAATGQERGAGPGDDHRRPSSQVAGHGPASSSDTSANAIDLRSLALDILV